MPSETMPDARKEAEKLSSEMYGTDGYDVLRTEIAENAIRDVQADTLRAAAERLTATIHSSNKGGIDTRFGEILRNEVIRMAEELEKGANHER